MMKGIITSLTLSMCALTALAQDAPSKLNYKEAVQIALKNNVNLNQQKNTLFSREVQRNQSVASFLPNLELRGTANRTDGQQNNPVTGALQDISVDYAGASLNASLPLFNGFTRINNLSQTNLQFKAQTALVERTEQDVISSVTSQYLQVLLDQELLRIAEENYNAQKITLDQTKEQVTLGARAEADLYSQDALVRNFEVAALRAKVTLLNDKATLSQILQLDPAASFEVAYPEDLSIQSIDSLKLDELYEVALTNRKDLKQQEYQVEANKALYRSSISGYMPNISFFASYGSQYLSNLNGGFREQFVTLNPQTQYGINFSIPLFDRLQTRSNRVLNKVTYDNAVLQRNNLEKTVKIDVLRAYNNYLAAIENYQASQAQLQSGELAFRTQRESFILGLSNQVNLALASQTYIQAAASKAQAEITLIFQKVLLDYALGTLNFESIP